MRLDSVRSLKRDLCSGHRSGFGDVGSSVWSGPAHSGVALGMLNGARPDDCRLALRVQRPSRSAEALVAHALTTARGEAEVQFVGAVYAPRPLASSDPTLSRRTRPLVPGLSVGHFSGPTGTLGAFARNANGDVVVLSNAHVLCASECARGDEILQPGDADGGTLFRGEIARLTSAMRPQAGRTNFLDAATATIDEGVAVRLEYGFGRLRGHRTDVPSGVRVWKKGRTTGFTRGIVRAVEVDAVEVGYGAHVLVLDNQIEIGGIDGAFSDGGDSGSLILDEESAAVGLLFAGTSATQGAAAITFANPIAAVLQALNIELL